MPESKKPDAGALCREFVSAWKGREDKREKQRDADAAMHAANEQVGATALALDALLPDDGPRTKSFSCDGWVVMLARPAKGQKVAATAIPEVKAEPV